MKVGFLISAAFLLGGTALAATDIQYLCKSGNDSLEVSLSTQSTAEIAIALTDGDSGTVDADGMLHCSGPNENSYLCGGLLRFKNPGPKENQTIQVQAILSESLFQGHGGIVQIDRKDYHCQETR